MAGSPTWGKISTGIRRTARYANSAIATSATTTVMGRLSAARTSRIRPLSACQECFGRLKPAPLEVAQALSPANTLQLASLAGLCEKRLKITGHGRDLQQPAPDTQASQCVIDLRLRQQPLRFRHFVDIGQARLVARRGLLQCGARSSDLNWSIGHNFASASDPRRRSIPARFEIGRNLLVASILGANSSRLRRSPCLNCRKVHGWKSHREPQRVILYA